MTEDNKENTIPAVEEDTTIPARQRAEQLIGYLQAGKHVHDMFGDAFERQYLIYGKPIREWRSYFRVSIPESPDTAQCRAIAAKIAALFQEATFYFAAAEAQLDALTTGETREYGSNFNKLILEYKVAGRSLPAAKTLETMAGTSLDDVRGAISSGKIAKNFWKRILESLSEIRKLLENATWNSNIESRQNFYDRGGNLPQNTPNRGTFGGNVSDED